MKVILAASDLSARSDRALARAVMMARQHGARLSVLHVIDEELPARLADHQRLEAQQTLQDTMNTLLPPHEVSLSIEVVIGEHYQTIIDHAESLDADLIVLGQHRKDILLDLFRGSTGERIIRFGTRPVLVVKTRATHPYVCMLAAIDFSPPARKAVEVGLSLAPEAEIKLVHAFDVPFRGLQMGGKSIDELAKKHQRQFQDMVDRQTAEFVAGMPRTLLSSQIIAREGAPDRVILSVADEVSADLVVIGTHGRSGLGRLLLGSVTETVMSRAVCDVLAVRGW
jgi:nucleotide-binding universal stress UspA family protein